MSLDPNNAPPSSDSGILDNIDKLDAIGYGKMATSLPIPGVARPIMDVAGGVLEYAEGDEIAYRQKKRLKEAGFDERVFSTKARNKLQSLDSLAGNKLIKYTIMAIAGLVGGLVFAALLSGIPYVGSAIGLFGGGALTSYIADKIYEGTCPTQEQDVVTLAAETFFEKKITNDKAFATLVASLPQDIQASYEDKLENMGGPDIGRDFARATQSDKGIAALRVLQQDTVLQDILRAHVGIVMDPRNPDKKVWEQYAELLNNKLIDPRDIVLNPHAIPRAANRYYMRRAMNDKTPPHNDNDMPQHQLPPPDRSVGRGLSPK